MSERFVQSLLFEGRLLISTEPQLALTRDDQADLQSALAAASLQLPGPRLTGSVEKLERALAVVYRAGWRFLHADLLPATDDPALRMPAGPQTPNDHLAADVAFRFLAGLYQRAFSRDPESDLAEALQTLLRQWPLSGVLADLSDPPETPVEFGGHPGLGFLYAERLAARERPAWIPNGSARACVEVVYDALGKPQGESSSLGV